MGKPVCEQIWVDDINGDEALSKCNPNAFGVWWRCLLLMFKNGGCSIEGTMPQLASLSHGTTDDVRNALIEFVDTHACNVEARPLDSDDFRKVTLADMFRIFPKNSEKIPPEFLTDSAKIPVVFRLTNRRRIKAEKTKEYDRLRKSKSKDTPEKFQSDSEQIPKKFPSRAYAGKGKGIGKEENKTTLYHPERGSAEGENELALEHKPERFQALLDACRADSETNPDTLPLAQALKRSHYLGETAGTLYLRAANPPDKFTLGFTRNHIAILYGVSAVDITLASP